MTLMMPFDAKSLLYDIFVQILSFLFIYMRDTNKAVLAIYSKHPSWPKKSICSYLPDDRS